MNESDDVNERVETEWVEETTAFERVRAVMKRTYEPRSAPEIAERARTTPTTARTHLNQLSEDGFVETTVAGQATHYQRSPASLVLEQAHDILDEVDRDTLVDRIAGMREEIDSYRETFDAESPEDAVIDDGAIDRETVREWRTTRRNLDLAKAALAISEAEDTVGTTTAKP